MLQQIGTGFTNIDKILNANQDAGAAVAQQGADLLGGEKKRYSDAMSGADKAIGQFHAGGGPKMLTAGDISSMGGGALGQAVNQKWSGPSNVNFSLGSPGQDQLNALANPASAGRQLAVNSGAAPGSYSPQQSSIDAAIYGSGQNANAVGNVRNNTAAFDKEATKGTARVNKQLGDINAKYGAANDANRGTLQSESDRIMAEAQKKADAANVAQDTAQGRHSDVDGAWTGTGRATANNFIGGNLGELGNISKALGIAGPQFAGNFQAGHYAQDPDKVAAKFGDALRIGDANVRGGAMQKMQGTPVSPEEAAKARVLESMNPGDLMARQNMGEAVDAYNKLQKTHTDNKNADQLAKIKFQIDKARKAVGMGG